MKTQFGADNLIFGSKVPDLPFDVPVGCKWRIRARNDKRWAKIYLIWPNRTEEWYLGIKNDKLTPIYLMGTNIKKSL